MPMLFDTPLRGADAELEGDPLAIVETARAWLATPYHHQASTRDAGCDCLGLIRGVWRDLYGHEPETPPPYTRDWTEASGRETLIAAADRHFTPVTARQIRPGDMLVFRIRRDVRAKHAGILTGAGSFIHAVENAGVVEVPLVPWWARRVAAAYRFPKITRH